MNNKEQTLNTMHNPRYLYLVPVNQNVSFAIVISEDAVQSMTFALDNETAQDLQHQLEAGRVGSYTLSSDVDSVTLVLSSDVPLFYAVSDDKLSRFVRRLAKPVSGTS